MADWKVGILSGPAWAPPGHALLFAAPVFAGGGLDRFLRWLLLANGAAVVPILLTYFVDRAFLAIAGPVWGIAIPTASVLLAIWFRRAGQAQRRAAAPGRRRLSGCVESADRPNAASQLDT